MMTSITLIALVFILVLLISLSSYLLVNNWSNETLSKTVPSILFGLIGLIATITFGAKESSSQKTFEIVYFFNPATNEILNPAEFDLQPNYDLLFSPNKSDNHIKLQSYPKKIQDLTGDEHIDFDGFVNAKLLHNIFTAIQQMNISLMNVNYKGTDYNEDLNIHDLSIKHIKPIELLNKDSLFEWPPISASNMEIPMPEGIRTSLRGYNPSEDLSGRRDLVIYRKNFFELRITAVSNGSGYSKKHGYGSVKIICATKFDKLTSQHYKTKTYKAYCQAIIQLIEKRFNDKENAESYFKKEPLWSKQ